MQEREDERRLHNELDVEATTRPEEPTESLWRQCIRWKEFHILTEISADNA